MLEKESVNITEDEAALYDRQIRLWGLDAQKRLRAAKVLLVGVSGLGAEVAKNIVLSGIKSLVLLDHHMVSEEDACSQFLADRSDLGKNRAEASLQRTQQLNPMVEVTADPSNVVDKPDEFFTGFNVICATCCSQEQLLRINKISSDNNIMFFAGDVFGFYGYMFADLGEHHYAEEVKLAKKKETGRGDDGEPAAKKAKPDNEEETRTEKKTAIFCRLSEALAVDWSQEETKKRLKRMPKTFFTVRVLMAFQDKHNRAPSTKSLAEDKKELGSLQQSVLEKLGVATNIIPEDFLNYCFAELSPVCAVTGGVLGQEIIKAVSQKDCPHNNFFFYNGVEGSGMVDRIG